MDILYWILLGAFVGLAATFLSRRVTMGELLSTTFLGVLGSLLGGLVGNLLFKTDAGQMNIYSYFSAVITPLVLMLIDKRFSSQKV